MNSESEQMKGDCQQDKFQNHSERELGGINQEHRRGGRREACIKSIETREKGNIVLPQHRR